MKISNLNSSVPTVSMRRGVMRAVGLLGVTLLFVGILVIEYGTNIPKKTMRGTSHIQGGDVRDGVSAPGMQNVQDTGLKFPWHASLLRKQNSSEELIKQQLIPGMIAPNVFYMWCGKDRWFEFKHYISILSLSKAFPVDKIMFYYEHLPAMDKMYYNLWYSDVRHDMAFFIENPMEDWQKKYCERGVSVQEKLEIIMQLLNQEGGIFVTENTWVFEISPTRRLVDLEMAYNQDIGEGYVMMRHGTLTNTTVEALMYQQSPQIKQQQCSRIHHVYYGPDLGPCTILKGGRYQRIWPMDIWELDDPFGRLVRRMFYGTEEIRKPKPDYDTLVPNIGHMVWIGGGRMDFVFYLSVLSLLYVANVETVYVHGDMEPAGENWKTIKLDPRTKDRVLFNKRVPPYQIYQGVIEPWYRALMSDLIRVDLMIKYGGIYTDTDAIWVKPLSREDRAYDAVASFDWVDWSWPYPDSVNFGISYGKKNAPFWQIFRESMRELHNEHHGFTGVMMPYKLLEKYPHLLRIDRRLQVICYYSKCHPIFVNDYHNMTKDHTNMHSLDNWQQDINAFHWTYPNPSEYSNMSTLMESTGMFADVGKFVLRKAGIIS